MTDRHEKAPKSAGVLRPSESLWDRLACRIAAETGVRPLPAPTQQWSEPAWEDVAPGISFKWLAVDVTNERLTLLVRVAPTAHYPVCLRRAIRELYILHGELWINGRKCYPGEYNRTEASDAHPRLWSEPGCTCLVIAVFSDVSLHRSNLRRRHAKPGRTRPTLRTIRRRRAPQK